MSDPVDPNAWQQRPDQPPYYGPPPTAQPPPQPGWGYPPPGYPAQAYPAQGYPAQAYPAEGYPAPGYPPPHPAPGYAQPEQPPRRNRRLILILAASAVVVVAVGVTLGVLLTGGSSGGSPSAITAPRSVGGYDQVTGDAADRVKNAISSFASSVGGTGGNFLQHATIAVYSDSGDLPDLIFVGVSRSQATAAGAPDDNNATASGLLTGAVPSSDPFDSGSHGGVLRCGSATFGAAQESMCAWSDSDTVGLLVAVNPARPPAELARTANQFRDALG